MLVYLPECVAVVIVVLLQKWVGNGDSSEIVCFGCCGHSGKIASLGDCGYGSEIYWLGIR